MVNVVAFVKETESNIDMYGHVYATIYKVEVKTNLLKNS